MFTSFNLFQEITLIAKQNLYDENNIMYFFLISCNTIEL